MTAVRARRTRNTVLALLAAVVGLAAVAVLGVSGVRSLSDSTAGRQAEGQASSLPTQRLPFTRTALVGVADEDGRLTSVAAWVLEPTGVGGKILGFAGTADASSGTASTLSPLAAVLEVGGAEEFLTAAERLTGLSFDVVEVLDQRRFAQIIAPLGDLPVLVPIDVADASSGDRWDAGPITLSGPGVARLITATDPAIADWAYEPARSSVWDAVADRVGAGVGSVPPATDDLDVPTPTSLDQFAERLYAAPVEFRSIGFVPIDDERIGEELDPRFSGSFDSVDAVVAHDRAELVILLGAVAPGRIGAPLDAPVFRVVSPFTDADVEELGLNTTDVLKRAVDRLFFAQANLVAVVDEPTAAVPDTTQLLVADPTVTDAVREVYGPLFGDIEVVPAKVRIDGIDIDVTLGRSFIEQLRGESVDGVAGSVGDDADEANDADPADHDDADG